MADSVAKKERRLMYPRSRMYDLVDTWLDDPFENSFMGRVQPFEWRMQEFGPSVDVIERNNEIVINAEVPGMNPEDIDISISGNAIRISGEKRSENEEEVQGRRYSERSYGSFCRVIPMPSEVDTKRVEARFKQGLLTVTIQKSQEAIQRTKRIPIKTEYLEAQASQPVNRQDIETMGAEEAIRQMENPPGREFGAGRSVKDAVTRQPAEMDEIETMGAEDALEQLENPPGQQQFYRREPSKDSGVQQPVDMQDIETMGAEEAIQQLEKRERPKKP